MSAYLTFGLWFAAILGFVAMMLIANARLGPKPQSNAVKLEAFERGAKPVDPHKVKAVSIKQYAVAIVFILFDLETVFLFNWALGAQPLTDWPLLTFVFFVVLLVLTLAYAWKSRLIDGLTE